MTFPLFVSHSLKSTLGSSESLAADVTSFPGCCSQLFYMNDVSHSEAFLGESGHILSVSVDALLLFNRYFFLPNDHIVKKLTAFGVSLQLLAVAMSASSPILWD